MNRVGAFCTLVLALPLLTTLSEPQEQAANMIRAADLLPRELAGSGLHRASPVTVYEGRALFEYINGAAELYHHYEFLEAATARYAADGAEITIDIYRFRDADRAFGLLSAMRPAEPDTLGLGAAGFSFGPGLDFVQGACVVRVVCLVESAATAALVRRGAAAIAATLPGTGDLPAAFRLFPSDNRRPAAEKLTASSFLGHDFLRNVYSVDYALDGEPLTLFCVSDPKAEAFRQWSDAVAPQTAAEVSVSDMPFDGGRAFVARDPYHGLIVAGLCGTRLVGMVPYRPVHAGFLASWIRSLTASDEH